MATEEIRTTQPSVLDVISTCELQWELERREGITAYKLGPESRYNIVVDGAIVHAGKGPCTLTVNID